MENSVDHNERCKQLVTAIEKISQNELEEIFKMIHNHGCSYTRNNNGLFINLRWIPEELLLELEQYVKFCSRSQTELKKYESICHVLNTKLREDANNSHEDKNISLHLNLNLKEELKPDVNDVIEDNVDDIDEDINELELTNTVNNSKEKEQIDEITEKAGSKISSSMKFALLKKRYAKMSIININNIENDLKQENYIIKN